MEHYTEEEIKKIIQAYHHKREREKQHYDKIKDTDEFKNYNRQKVKNWYQENKDKRKQEYQDNKEIKTARSSYYYYKKKDRVDDFKEKYPEKYQLLVDNHYL